MMFLLCLALLAGPASAGGRPPDRPPRPHLCPEDAPEGVRLPPRPGCGSGETSAPRREPGVYDLGNGTGIRVGGRAGAVYDMRR